MKVMQISFLLITIFLITITHQKDPSTFANYDIIQQSKIEVNFNVDFTNKIVTGKAKIYFKALDDGEVIALDTKALIINSVIDSDTGDYLEYKIDNYYKLESLGIPLKIYKDYQKDDEFSIVINFSTTEDGMALDWLNPEQTFDKKYPFMYSQCQSILCRELMPIQDTPAVKIPVSVSITVPKPLLGLVGGIYQGEMDNGNTTTYFYEQKIPIPSYLIAIAAGDIAKKNISDRCNVYAERDIVEKAAYEFSDTEIFIQLAEAYATPYEWGEYNILVLPPSFPFGGMENPCLTFVTPSLIAGDKSLASVIAHEISHSWTGNLVTNENWADFWLNEGFTMFLQRKIMENYQDLDMAKLSEMVGVSGLRDDIEKFGESKLYTSLQPHLIGRSPEDYFNLVPYEKGFNLLYYIENLMNTNSNKDLFRRFLRRYINKFRYGIVKYEYFKNFLEEFIIEEDITQLKNITKEEYWNTWIYAPGFPPKENNFSNKYADEVENMVNLFYQNKLPANFVDIFKGWFTLLKQNFLSRIKEANIKLTDEQLEFLSEKLNLKHGYNVEVTCLYYNIVLYLGKVLKDDVKDALIDFLGTIGRINYVRPLYTALYLRNKELALKTLDKYRHFYHATIIKYIELDFKTIG